MQGQEGPLCHIIPYLGAAAFVCKTNAAAKVQQTAHGGPFCGSFEVIFPWHSGKCSPIHARPAPGDPAAPFPCGPSCGQDPCQSVAGGPHAASHSQEALPAALCSGRCHDPWPAQPACSGSTRLASESESCLGSGRRCVGQSCLVCSTVAPELRNRVEKEQLSHGSGGATHSAGTLKTLTQAGP